MQKCLIFLYVSTEYLLSRHKHMKQNQKIIYIVIRKQHETSKIKIIIN